jgi:hypothetical protein
MPLITPLGNPANQLGGPGSCRAKWRIVDDEGSPSFISNAELLAAFNHPTVPTELRQILAAIYHDDNAVQAATSASMRFSLGLHQVTANPPAAGGMSAQFAVQDGPDGPPRIQISGTGAVQTWELEVAFHHSETR